MGILNSKTTFWKLFLKNKTPEIMEQQQYYRKCLCTLLTLYL